MARRLDFLRRTRVQRRCFLVARTGINELGRTGEGTRMFTGNAETSCDDPSIMSRHRRAVRRSPRPVGMTLVW